MTSDSPRDELWSRICALEVQVLALTQERDEARLNARITMTAFERLTGEHETAEAAFAALKDSLADQLEISNGHAARAAALTGQLQQMQWQPIETAPKDDAEWLLLSDGRSVPYVGRWFVWKGRNENDGFWQSHAVEVNPTHWMSLPEPQRRAQEPT